LLIVFQKKEEQLDNYSFFASAYTIKVRNLPITATEESVNEHFERVTESSVAEVYSSPSRRREVRTSAP
jgi:hypothetical protein